MDLVAGGLHQPGRRDVCRNLVARVGPGRGTETPERHVFYERAKSASAVLAAAQTGLSAKILNAGVARREGVK